MTERLCKAVRPADLKGEIPLLRVYQEQTEGRGLQEEGYLKREFRTESAARLLYSLDPHFVPHPDEKNPPVLLVVAESPRQCDYYLIEDLRFERSEEGWQRQPYTIAPSLFYYDREIKKFTLYGLNRNQPLLLGKARDLLKSGGSLADSGLTLIATINEVRPPQADSPADRLLAGGLKLQRQESHVVKVSP